MSNRLDFDKKAAQRLEAVYQTPDVVEQRIRTLRALNLRPGESILDIGSGPGLLLRDLGITVGGQGRAVGFDMSPSMLAMGEQRCADLPWIEFEKGNAISLPFENDTFDAVVSTQVYEYLSDIPKAFQEVHRVLRPGGRFVVVDTDYDSWVVHTEDRERFARIRVAWDEHFVYGDLPRRTIPFLRDIGFQVFNQEVIPMFNTDYHPNTYSHGMVNLIAQFVAGRAGVSVKDAEAWKNEMENLGTRGAYFFSLNRYLFVAQK